MASCSTATTPEDARSGESPPVAPVSRGRSKLATTVYIENRRENVQNAGRRWIQVPACQRVMQEDMHS